MILLFQVSVVFLGHWRDLFTYAQYFSELPPHSFQVHFVLFFSLHPYLIAQLKRNTFWINGVKEDSYRSKQCVNRESQKNKGCNGSENMSMWLITPPTSKSKSRYVLLWTKWPFTFSLCFRNNSGTIILMTQGFSFIFALLVINVWKYLAPSRYIGLMTYLIVIYFTAKLVGLCLWIEHRAASVKGREDGGYHFTYASIIKVVKLKHLRSNNSSCLTASEDLWSWFSVSLSYRIEASASSLSQKKR